MKINSLLFSLVTLLTLAFTLLRSAKNALVVADLGGSAAMLPYYEFFGTLPASILMTWMFARLLQNRSLPKLFYEILTVFVLFFVIFSTAIYPLWRNFTPEWLASNNPLLHFCSYAIIGLFVVLAELWKVALISLLLWGYVNNYIPIERAKTTYAPLMLGTSIGGFLAGPIINFFELRIPAFIESRSIDSWHAMLVFEVFLIAILSVLIAGLFYALTRCFNTERIPEKSPNPNMKLSHCFSTTYNNPLLYALAIIVLTDYLSYTLYEVIFLDALKSHYPTPLEYNQIMGELSQWSGLLIAFAALGVGPYLAKRYSWTSIAMITPLSVVLLGTPFLVLMAWDSQTYLSEAILIGSICYCVCRATKYALLDSAKEIAYIPLPEDIRMQGKLIVDGLTSRGGRALASVSSIGLIAVSGGILASAPISLVFFIISSTIWMRSTVAAGQEMD